MATATKRKKAKKKSTKTASDSQAMNPAEFREKLQNLTPATRKKVKRYMDMFRISRKRAYSDTSITKGEYRLNNLIGKEGSRRMGDFVLNMTRRRGMSSQDLSNKRDLRSCAADLKGKKIA